jgi:nucleoside-diphosphate-sugar epimerase
MITVLGARGFIGSRIVEKLAFEHMNYYAPHRGENLQDKDLGDVIYCIGLTADFRTKPFETVEAHVCRLHNLLTTTRFSSILYLSSTRLYGFQGSVAKENADFSVNPGNPSDLYNISKLMGEALLNASEQSVRIARLANVFGGDLNSENFLSDVIKCAVQAKHVKLETTLESEKDYISIGDVVDLLIKIASGGKYKIYNVASGINTSNQKIMNKLAGLTGCVVEVAPHAKTIKFPVIDNEIVRSEFGYRPSNMLDEMEKLVDLYQSQNGE